MLRIFFAYSVVIAIVYINVTSRISSVSSLFVQEPDRRIHQYNLLNSANLFLVLYIKPFLQSCSCNHSPFIYTFTHLRTHYNLASYYTVKRTINNRRTHTTTTLLHYQSVVVVIVTAGSCTTATTQPTIHTPSHPLLLNPCRL